MSKEEFDKMKAHCVNDNLIKNLKNKIKANDMRQVEAYKHLEQKEKRQQLKNKTETVKAGLAQKSEMLRLERLV